MRSATYCTFALNTSLIFAVFLNLSSAFLSFWFSLIYGLGATGSSRLSGHDMRQRRCHGGAGAVVAREDLTQRFGFPIDVCTSSEEFEWRALSSSGPGPHNPISALTLTLTENSVCAQPVGSSNPEKITESGLLPPKEGAFFYVRVRAEIGLWEPGPLLEQGPPLELLWSSSGGPYIPFETEI